MTVKLLCCCVPWRCPLQLKPIAEELGCSLAQLSIAWCIRNPRWVLHLLLLLAPLLLLLAPLLLLLPHVGISIHRYDNGSPHPPVWTIRVSTAILGATKIEQLEDNLGALKVLPKLTNEVVERIEAIVMAGEAAA